MPPLTGIVLGLLAVVSAFATAGCVGPRPATTAGASAVTSSRPPVVRRLTVKQYRNTITDLFGPDLTFPPLDEEPAVGGFSTTGAAKVGTSASGVELYLSAADSLARQITSDEARRYTVVGCVPRTANDVDCARRFVTRVGRAAFRRPLLPDEEERFVALSTTTATGRQDFWAGLRVALTALLASPSFIYVVERGRPDGRLTSWELGARLSLFLWNTSPDQLLLDAAARGELDDDAGVSRHVKRLLAAPRARLGIREFFSELYRMDQVERVSRDKAKEPKVSVRAIGRTMKEETMLVLEHNVFVDRADFRTLFTTRDTFLNKDLAVIYGAKVMDGGMFTKIMLPEDSPRRGLLGQGAFLTGTSSPDKTSPTARGKFVRENFLCEPIAAPPPNVDTNLPPAEGQFKTVRQRLEEHRNDFGCNKCHKLIDTIGLAFERFDHFGEYRLLDNNEVIDESGELDGKPFASPIALGQLLASDPRVPACLVRNLYSYATGRIPEAEDTRALQALQKSFAASGYRVLAAIETLVMSPSFTHLL